MNAESPTHHGRHALPDHLHLEVGTVSGLIFSGVVYEVNLPGSAGGMGVLPGHVPVLTTLDAGMLSYRTSADAEPAALYVVGGLAEVGPGYVHVLADHAVHSEEADAVRRAEALRLVQMPNHRSSHDCPTPNGGGLGIAGMAAYYFPDCTFDAKIWLIFLYPTLFFIGTTLYVKSVLRERKNPLYLYASILFHAILVLGLMFVDWQTALCFIPAWLRAVIAPRFKLSVKQTGLLEMATSLLFLVSLLVV